MALEGKVMGKLMGIAIGDKPEDYADPDNFIACEINAELYFEKQMIPASSPIDGKWETFVPGKRNWYITVDGHLLTRAVGADIKTLYRAFVNDELLTIRFRTRPVVDQYVGFTGQAYVRSGALMAPTTGLSGWQIQLQGAGALDMEWEEFWTIINAQPPQADWPLIVEQDPDNWQL